MKIVKLNTCKLAHNYIIFLFLFKMTDLILSPDKSKHILLSIDIGIKNFAYCIFNKTDNYIITFNDIELQNTTNPSTITHTIIKLLDSLLINHNIQTVIIEQQVINNVKAMNIQYIILTYCEMKNIKSFLFNPKNKFKFEKDKLSYRQRKQKSIEYCMNVLKHIKVIDATKEFNDFVKKDDIADAIVMAVFYSMPSLTISLYIKS